MRSPIALPVVVLMWTSTLVQAESDSLSPGLELGTPSTDAGPTRRAAGSLLLKRSRLIKRLPDHLIVRNYNRAIDDLGRVLGIEQSVFGRGDVRSLETLGKLADVYLWTDQAGHAEKLRREILKISERAFGAGSWQASEAHRQLRLVTDRGRLDAANRHVFTLIDEQYASAWHQFEQGDVTAALQTVSGCLELHRKLGNLESDRRPIAHPHVVDCQILRLRCMIELGQFAAAVPFSRKVTAMAARVYSTDHFPQGHPALAECQCAISSLFALAGDRTQALEAARRAVAICRSLYPAGAQPPGNRISAMSLRILARLRRADGEIQVAKELLDECHQILTSLFPTDEYPEGHTALAVTLDAYGDLYSSRGEYDKAIFFLQRAWGMREAMFPPESYPRGHRRLAANLSRIGTTLLRQGKYESAATYHERALAMYRRLHPPDKYPNGHLDLARQFGDLSDLELARGNLDAARQHAEQALAMVRRLRPAGAETERHPDVAHGVLRLGKVLRQQGKYALAREQFAEALRINQQLFPQSVFPQGHIRLFECYNSLGVIAWHEGDLEQAADFLDRAVHLSETLQTKINPLSSALASQNLATVLYSKRHLSRARGLYEKSMSIYRKVFPTDRYPRGHPYLATTLMNLGTARFEQGDYRAAAAHFVEAAQMFQTLFPTADYPNGHPLQFKSLINLATVLNEHGDHAGARVCLERALEVGKLLYPVDTYPDGHPDLTGALNNLAISCEALGESRQSLQYSRDALDMSRSLYPQDSYPNGHPTLATRLHNVGTRYLLVGNGSAAKESLAEAIGMRQRLYPSEQFPRGNSFIASSLQMLALAHFRSNEFIKARQRLDEALRMYTQLAEDPQTSSANLGLAESLKMAGALAIREGDYAAASSQFQNALAALRLLYPVQHFPDGHPSFAGAYMRLARTYHALGRLRDAQQALQRAGEINRNAANRLLPFVSEAEAFNFLASQPRTRNRLLSVSLQLNEPAEMVYSHLWSDRGAIQRTAAIRQRQLAETTGERATDEYDLWLDRRREIAQLTLMGLPDDSDAAHRRRGLLARLTAEKELLERRMASRLSHDEWAKTSKRSAISVLQERLPDQSAFVDIRLYSHFEYRSDASGSIEECHSNRYVAFVVTPKGSVTRVELGSAETTDKAVFRWRESIMAGHADTTYQSPAAWLRRTIWQPIERVLSEQVNTVFICPDGALTGLPWAALPDAEPGSVLLERYAFATVPYGDFLVGRLTGARTDRPDGPFLIVGAVDYEARPTSTTELRYQLRAPTGREGRVSWHYLPETVGEVEGVAEMAGGEGDTVLLFGPDANTIRVLAELPRARRAHFATHGFFADAHFRSVFQIDPELFESESMLLRPERTRVAGRNPLVLSGLVLAGANRPRERDALGLPSGDGGILTAESIAGLRLHQLELVTLSACDSGLGDLAGGEGVFGLQRAFHTAGAQTVVASLWKVDDRSTRELMLEFYANLYRRGMTKLDALRAAQLRIVHGGDGGRRDRGLVRRVSPRPAGGPRRSIAIRRWAAWVLSGDWR